ncbi:hypothetical protein GOBAR_AA38506 [Gossypium barbadense]|uniref:STAR protein homodimerisation region domain-containing protein n=1 Tax=Gossypium barbadense TaxID=3634 RepID=A0A2P5VTQ7_GOSBA|nr:hypothetical protein GOBAR_AA38506 [Gossypium barbadense]
MSGLYNHRFSPVRTASPHIRNTPDIDSNQLLSELLAEHQKLGPFMQILPTCSRLLNQEILRVSGMTSNQGFGDFDRMRHRSPSPMASSNIMSNVSGTGLSNWNSLPQERLSGPPGMTMDWQGAPASPSSYNVKRILRLEIPVDTYPNDESQDFIKRQQLRELTMLNSNFREESPGPTGSVSPFNCSGMKRPKTGR